MNKSLAAKASMRLIPTLAAVTIGLFASVAMAQNYMTRESGKAEVRRDNTADPNDWR